MPTASLIHAATSEDVHLLIFFIQPHLVAVVPTFGCRLQTAHFSTVLSTILLTYLQLIYSLILFALS